MITEFPATALSDTSERPQHRRPDRRSPVAVTWSTSSSTLLIQRTVPPRAGSAPAIPQFATSRFAVRWPKLQISSCSSTSACSASGIRGCRSCHDRWVSTTRPRFPTTPTARKRRTPDLDAAGYVDTDGDGIRECKADQQCPTGDLTFRFNYPDDSDVGARGVGSDLGHVGRRRSRHPDPALSIRTR